MKDFYQSVNYRQQKNMSQGFPASQLGYEFVPKEFLEQSNPQIKKIQSIQLSVSPLSNKSESEGSSYNPFIQKMGQIPIWKQLMSSGFSQQFNINQSQMGYNPNDAYRYPECNPQMMNQSYPTPYNQQMPNYGQQYNSYQGNQFIGNQPNPPNYYNNQIHYSYPNPNQNHKKDSNNLKTGFNLINEYNNKNQVNKNHLNQPMDANQNGNSFNQPNYNSSNNIIYPSLFPPNEFSPSKSDPLSKSHEYTPSHQTPHQRKIKNKNSIQQFAMNKKQKMAWNDWATILDRIKHSINASDTQNNLVSNFFWEHLLDKLQPYYLNKKRTIEFFYLIKEYFLIDPQNTNFDPLAFFNKFGDSFKSFETNLFFEHKSYLEFAKFISLKCTSDQKKMPTKFLNLTFNLTNQQTLDVAKTVFKLCEHNLDAFSFLSLYLIVSIEKGLTLESFQLVESEFIDTIAILDKKYPASNAESFSSNLFEADIKKKYDKPKIQFKSINPRENFKDLQNFVFQKVKTSRYDQFKFRKLVQSVCLKHGYNFKLGHKIKLDNNKYSMLRTIEKILQDILPKYKEQIKLAKDRIINVHREKKSENEILHTIIRTQIEVVSQLMGQILTAQKAVEFNIKDLLRAKCSFNSVYAIKQALTDLKALIQSFPDCQIIETKNKLSNRTKDFAVIIKLPNCIAELQLVLNLNSIPNQFNHKIYQMLRTKLFSPITNLYLCHNKWSQNFFRKFLQLIKRASKSQKQPKIYKKISFKDFKDDIKIFKKIVSHFSELNKERLKEINEQNAKDIEKEFDLLNQTIYKSNERICMLTDDERTINEIRFFLSAKEYQKAQQCFQKIDQNQIQNNPILLQLQTEILFSNQFYGKCLQKSLKLADMYSQPTDKVRASMKIGDTYLYLPDLYQKALEQYQYALQIIRNSQKQQVKNAKFNTKDNNKITQADVLNSIGVVFLKQNILDKALEKFNQSQKLYKENKQGNSMKMAWTYVNIGKVFQNEQKFKQSEESYKAGLQIIEKYKGKYSVQAGKVLQQLCQVYLGMGKQKNIEDSLDLAKRAYDIVDHILGRNNTQTKKCLVLIEKCMGQMDVLRMFGKMGIEEKNEEKK